MALPSPHRWMLTAVLALVAIGFSLAAIANLRGATSAPWVDRVPFFFPYSTALDQQGRSFVIDSGTRRLVALQADGSLRWVLPGGQRENGFYYAQGLGVDGQDRLYVYNWVPYPGADYKAQELQIQRYDEAGRLEKTVFRLPNAAESDDFPAYFGFFIEKDQLFTLVGDGEKFVLSRSSTEGGAASVLRELPANKNFVALAATSDGRVAGAARDGSVWEALPGKDWEQVALPGVKKPWHVRYQADGRLVILDLLTGTLQRREQDASLSVLLASADTKGVFADTFAIAPGGAVAVADKDLQRLLVSTGPGDLRAFEGAVYSPQDKLGQWLFWGSAALAALFLVAALLHLYVVLADRRLPLLVLQLTVFVPIIILAQVFAVTRVYDTLSTRYEGQVNATLMNAAALTAKLLPPADVQALNVPSDFDSPAYLRLKTVAKGLQKIGQDADGFNYIAIYREINGLPHYVFTASGTFGVDYPYTLLPAEAKGLFQEPGLVYAQYFDDYGVYNAAFSSLVGADGRPVGVVEVGRFADLIQEMNKAYVDSAIRTALFSGVLFVVMFVILTLFLLRSLNVLRKMTREIAGGQLDTSPVLHSRDEIGQLSRDFERMSGRLKGYLTDITAETAASARFVPRGLIEVLGQDDLTKLQLGDQTRRDMTVVFSSVTNFRKLTGEMNANGVFKYLNSYLSSVVPLIQEQNGVIDKYIGETYMALFPRKPEDAVQAWRLINRKIGEYNAKRVRSGSEGLDLTFGVHLGPLMLGIVGEQERFDGTVIADAVNLTSRLNGLARIYGVPCVISGSTLERMPREKLYRKLDHVTVKGKTEPLLVCQPLDGEDGATKGLVALLPAWNEAFAAWEAGRIKEASAHFDELESLLPADAVVRRHAQRCRGLVGQPPPELWSPAVQIKEK